MKSTTPLFLVWAATGLFHSAMAADEKTPIAVTTNPARAGDGVQVGVAKRDGVTITGGEAFVTRNGATEKLSKDLLLPSGVIARPNGAVILPNRTEINLRPTQMLTFDGTIVELAPDPNTNPGDPRGNGAPTGNASSVSTTQTGTSSAMPTGSSRSPLPDRPAASGSVFLGGDGTPFMGTLNPDGTILRADGTLLRADGSYRAVTFGSDGTPTVGTVNANGTVTPMNNATNGSTPGQNNLGTFNNGNTNPGVSQQNPNGGTTQTNNGVTTGRSNNNGGNNATSSGGTNSGTRGTNGASGGASNGGGATGAGGASGGSAGGASR